MHKVAAALHFGGLRQLLYLLWSKTFLPIKTQLCRRIPLREKLLSRQTLVVFNHSVTDGGWDFFSLVVTEA